MNLSAFRLGDIRGVYPDDIDEAFVESFAHAFTGQFQLTGTIATGRDMRSSSQSLQETLNTALAGIGIDVIDIGLCPTELGYFASGTAGVDAAIIITASHNSSEYNGLKCVLRNGQAITSDNGLSSIKALMQDKYRHPGKKGSVTTQDYRPRYLEFIKQHFDAETLQSSPVALNGLNGTAATMADQVACHFDIPATWFRKDPGPIPSEGADPTNPELLTEMRAFMESGSFGLGIAWDSDCDRCVCFDADGQLVPSYYLTGLLVEKFLKSDPGRAIVFDTKLCWNTLDIIKRYKGKPVPAETGHAFMKQKMHDSNAIYGGELSSHHYFGDFFGCDSGMFAWLTVLQLLNESSVRIDELVNERRELFYCTPEISLSLTDVDAALAHALDTFGKKAISVDDFDGLSFVMPGDWRFSIRRSKTEPLVRVNFEARQTPDLLMDEGRKVFQAMEPFRADDRNWLGRFQIQ